MCNHYFFCTWIIQEVSLAKRLVMYTKHDFCLWDEGLLAIIRQRQSQMGLSLDERRGVDLLPGQARRLVCGIKNMKTMEAFRKSYWKSPKGLPLNELLVRSTVFRCTNSRDRIYGLLGLTTKEARSHIWV